MISGDGGSLGTEPPPPGAGGGPPARPRQRRPPSRRIKVAAGIAIVLAVAVIVSSLVTVPYYAITPGTARSVLPLIGVPAARAQHHGGSVDLVDVEETPLKAIDWLYFHFDSNASIYSSAAIQGPETNAQYNTEGLLDMANAQQAAEVVALGQLGYHVTVVPDGSLVYALDPGSPAEASLAVGDVVVTVGTTAVSSPADLSAALASYPVGGAVALGYRPYPKGSPRTTTVHLGVWRWQGTGANRQLACVPADVKTSEPIAKLYEDHGSLLAPTAGHPGRATPCLGVIDAQPSYHVTLPFAVNLKSEGIVGPSAGLAFTLGLMQKLDPANLTGGLRVAATGTMAVNGDVGPIGGVQQKTIAVRSSGAAIFFVPPANYATAKRYAGSSLKVFAVANIAQALAVLERFGGKVVKSG